MEFVMINLNMEFIPREVWEKFSFSEYHQGEQTILKPYLESKGFKYILFEMGERDSFGPLSRIITMTSGSGDRVRLIYG
jgi:hypothetical protein